MGGARVKPDAAGMADVVGFRLNLGRLRILGLFLTRFRLRRATSLDVR